MTKVRIPPCEVCKRPGVAMVNNRGMCADVEHIRQVVDLAMDHLRLVVDLAKTFDPRVEP